MLVTQYDSPWKDVLERFFPQFMRFFFPGAYRAIDWTRNFEFLDKELQRVVRDADVGTRFVDKLVRVFLRSGEAAWVLIHIEVQGQTDADFSERLYVYNYRIFDRWRVRVVSLAILADTDPEWRPDRYGHSLWGCRVSLRFPVAKLLDYADRWASLERSRNPFAVVVMAHLKAQATARDPEARLHWKWQLVRGLYERGSSKQDVLELFRFIDWLMDLPPELGARFEEALQEYEEKHEMPYVTSIERRAIERGMQKGIERGIEQGIQKGAFRQLMRALRKRFGAVPEGAEAQLRRLDTERLEELLDEALTAPSWDAFASCLPS